MTDEVEAIAGGQAAPAGEIDGRPPPGGAPWKPLALAPPEVEARRLARALLLAEPPSIDAGEITDKGYVNQRAVLERRAALVEKLHCDGTVDPDVIRLPEAAP